MPDFNAKMHQNRFQLGLRPRPRWGSLQRSPRPLSWILRGPISKGGEGREREGDKRGAERGDGEVKGREGKGGGRGREGKRRDPLKNMATGLFTLIQIYIY